MLEVAVIGGGQAGLAIGWYLRKLGLRFRIFDSAPSVGQSWRDRWDSLQLFTPARFSALPGMRFPAPPDSYPNKDEVADYLSAYASYFSLPIQLSTRVTALTQGKSGFHLMTSQGEVTSNNVVIATGPFQKPVAPDFRHELSPSVFQLHSSEYRNPSQLPDGHILVVGGGNSGVQIAHEISGSRNPGMVSLAIGRRNACVPQKVLGQDIFWWQQKLGLLTAPADSARGKWMRQGEGTVIGLSQSRLKQEGVSFRSRLVNACDSTVEFSDGSNSKVSAVVWATGFRQDYSWLKIAQAIDHQGNLRHKRGVTEIPGLYTLGQPWQHTTGSALLGFVSEDAAYLAEQLIP